MFSTFYCLGLGRDDESQMACVTISIQHLYNLCLKNIQSLSVVSMNLSSVSLKIGFQRKLFFTKIALEVALAVVNQLMPGEVAFLEETFPA